MLNFDEITDEKEQDTVSISSDKSEVSSQEPFQVNVFEKTFKSDRSSNSEDVQKYEAKISQLEQENQQLNRQILNLQHLYSEVKNENAALSEQLQRANECVAETNAEMEQYRARAQRVLQEKEKLISYKNQADTGDTESDHAILTNYLEELKYIFSYSSIRFYCFFMG